MTSRLVLGTVQFGLDYGVNNKRGKIPKKEIFKILSYAKKKGINTLDTAYNYGKSEKIIGDYAKKTGQNFNIISKLPAFQLAEIDNFIQTSLVNLNTQTLYGYLFHDFKSFFNKRKTWRVLQKYQERGIIKNIGFSLYFPWEIEDLLKKNIIPDIVQIPYNIFDQRFSYIFPILKKKNIKVYGRSVFLQGLFFKNPDNLADDFKKIRSKLSLLKRISSQKYIPLEAILLNFVLLNPYIDKVVIGVDSFNNLKDDLKAIQFQPQVAKMYNQLLSLKETDEKIILPIKWI